MKRYNVILQAKKALWEEGYLYTDILKNFNTKKSKEMKMKTRVKICEIYKQEQTKNKSLEGKKVINT